MEVSKMLKVKAGREEFELNKNDEIMYNGACYQIITRLTGYGWNSSIPVIAKARAEKLIKEGKLVFNHHEEKRKVDIYKIAE
jgi:hypothetical protein